MSLGLGLGLGFGSQPGFLPTDLPGCMLWLRASAGITIATGVSAWADQSGKGQNATQGSGAAQPAYVASGIGGLPSVEGTGSQYLVTGALSAAPVAIFAVAQQTAPQAGGKGILGSSGSNALYTNNATEMAI